MQLAAARNPCLRPEAVTTLTQKDAAPEPVLLLSAEGVAKSFAGVRALADGRLALRPGTVHALCGGNGAGKSTFLNVLMGLIPRDAGRIAIRGREVAFATPAQAFAAGLAIITQELSPIPDMTVAENLYLGREPRRLGCLVDRARLNRQAGALLDRLRFRIEPTATMRSLSLAQTQLVEIAKAISHESTILIMDEPTSAIGEAEAEVLFDAIRTLTAQGVGVIYVSHRLTELFAIADDYTVFRDGGFVASGRMADIDRRGLVRLILGAEGRDEYRTHPAPSGPEMLGVTHLSRDGWFEDVTLAVGRGEILGLYGLMGAGRTEFLETVYGLARASRGELRIDGEVVALASPAEALRAGMALVTEDRKASGLVMTGSVRENATLSSLPRLSTGPFVSDRRERAQVSRMVDLFRIRARSIEAPVQSLSGGNQQKVVLARCLGTEPRILLCDEPTRGVDEGAKREVYAFLSRFVGEGGCAIMVSSELPEVLGMSDRVAVFRRGRVAGVLAAADASQERLMQLAS